MSQSTSTLLILFFAPMFSICIHATDKRTSITPLARSCFNLIIGGNIPCETAAVKYAMYAENKKTLDGVIFSVAPCYGMQSFDYTRRNAIKKQEEQNTQIIESFFSRQESINQTNAPQIIKRLKQHCTILLANRYSSMDDDFSLPIFLTKICSSVIIGLNIDTQIAPVLCGCMRLSCLCYGAGSLCCLGCCRYTHCCDQPETFICDKIYDSGCAFRMFQYLLSCDISYTDDAPQHILMSEHEKTN